MILALYCDALFCLNCLMQTLAVPAPGHLTPGELIDDDHLAIFDDIIFVALEDDLCLNRILHVARQVEVGLIVDVLDARQLLNLFNACLCENNSTCLLFNGVVKLWLEVPCPASELRILIGGFLSLTGADDCSTC